MNRTELAAKLGPVTAELFREKGYVSFVDVFIKLGYLDPKECENWRIQMMEQTPAGDARKLGNLEG